MTEMELDDYSCLVFFNKSGLDLTCECVCVWVCRHNDLTIMHNNNTDPFLMARDAFKKDLLETM